MANFQDQMKQKGVVSKYTRTPVNGTKEEKPVKSTPKNGKVQNKANKGTNYYDMEQYTATKEDFKQIGFRLSKDGSKLLTAIAAKQETNVSNLLIKALESYIKQELKESEIKEIKQYINI